MSTSHNDVIHISLYCAQHCRDIVSKFVTSKCCRSSHAVLNMSAIPFAFIYNFRFNRLHCSQISSILQSLINFHTHSHSSILGLFFFLSFFIFMISIGVYCYFIYPLCLIIFSKAILSVHKMDTISKSVVFRMELMRTT